MAEIIASLTTIFTAIIGYVGTVADTITAEPLLMLYVLVPIVGIGVGLFRRLLNVN